MSFDIYYDILEDADDEQDEEMRRNEEWAKYLVKRERLTYIGGHLCAPIVEEDCNFILSTPSEIMKGCRRHLRLKGLVDGKFSGCRLIADCTPDPIGRLQDWIREVDIKDTRHDFDMCKMAMDNLILHKMSYIKPYINSQTEKDFCHEKIKKAVASSQASLETLRGLYLDMRKAEKVKDTICFRELPDGDMIHFNGLWAEQDICVLTGQREGPMIFSTNLLLCALDKIQSRFGLEAYWRISDALEKYPNKSIYREGRELIIIFEGLRSVMGQDFFTLMAGYESLIVGWTVAGRNDLGCVDLFRSEAESSLQLLKKYNRDDLLPRILPKDRSFNSVVMHLELTGIIKVFGYPTLQAERMLDQIFEYGTKNKFDIDESLLRRVEGVMRREFCINYYKKHTRYPKILYFPRSLKNLGQNKPMPESAYKLYEDWACVVFGKTLEFDYVPDQSDMIKDSAAAVNRSAWASMYDGCAFRKRYGKPPPSKKERIYPTRTVEAYLNAGEDEIRKLIETQDEGTFNFEDWICVECQKECEMKGVCGRAFTKQTPPRRLIQVTMEHNIADGIFPYVPEQSMTDSEIKNAQRILNQVKSMQRTSHFMSLDLKKWCLNWRHDVVHMTGKMYDELFGLKTLYKNNHLFFVGCLVLSNNRLTPPDYDSFGNPIESAVCCRSFIGAMEGLNQKFWTHPTGALIRLTMETSEVTGDIMGQGDNQVIVLHFAKDDTKADEKRETFLKNLSTAMQGINHELKRQETWFSKNLHEYSKTRMYEGVSVSYGTKKASNIISDINDGLFSHASNMSTLNTITEGIAKADYAPDAAFMLNQFFQINYLLRKGIISNSCPNDTMRALLNWPLDFGGLPICSYVEHMVRGNDDKVAQWWGVMIEAKDLGLNVAKEMERLWVVKPAEPAKTAMERKRLYEDIFCLRVNVPPSCEAKMRDLIAEFLRNPEYVKNPAIRKLYETNCSVGYDSLVEALDLIRPNYLPASHELLSASNAGRLIQLQGKLTSSKTLQKVVQVNRSISLIQLIREKNDEFRSYVYNRIQTGKGKLNDYNDMCPSDIARKLRELSWGIETIDVTKAPLCHQIRVKPVDLCTEEELNAGISVRISGEMEQSPRQCYLTYGPARNYIGSKTKSKVKKSTINVIEKSGFIKSLQKIGLIRSWFAKIGDENMIDLCTALMEEKRPLISEMPEGLDDLGELCSTVTSGNILHRFKSSVEHDTAMLNCLHSISGHFEYSSNSMQEMTVGGQDWTIFYQYIMVGVTAGLALYTNLTGVAYGSYRVLFPCKGCTKLIPDLSLSMISKPVNIVSLAAPEYKFRSEVKSMFTPDRARFLMSVAVGYNLARNIDENYRVFHTQGMSSLTAMDYKKDVVSLNDLRQLQLDVILAVALSTSMHGFRLYWSRSNVLVAHSEDRSFMYLAECILEAGLVPKILQIIGVRATEHSSVTTAHGLSSYLSRHCGRYMDENGRSIISASTEFVFQDSSPYLLDNSLRFCCVWLAHKKLINYGLRKAILNELETTKNIGRAAKHLRVKLEVVPVDMRDMITHWRSVNKDFPNDLAHFPAHFTLPSRGNERYNFLDTVNYHSQRLIQGPGESTFIIPQLSFLARSIGVISTAVNKFVEVLIAFDLFFHLQDTEGVIVCLAEGSGGTLASLLAIFPRSKGLYNTWMRSDVANRDRVNDYSVPAAVALLLDSDRVINPNPLIIGQTDITHPLFLKKLTTSIDQHNPMLITIDAESPEGSMSGGSNIQFFQTTVVSILENSSAIIILKMFLQDETQRLITQILQPWEKTHVWYIFKPVSSNPVGKEVYLLIMTKEMKRSKNEVTLRDIEASVLRYVPTRGSMTKAHIKKYIQVAKDFSALMKSLFPESLLITHAYTNFFPVAGCGLFCPVFFDNLLDAFDRVHTSDSDFCVHLAVRMKGTNGTLFSLLHEIVFLMIWHSRGPTISFADQLGYLSLLELTTNLGIIRANLKTIPVFNQFTTQPLGLWKTWEDARMYLSANGQGEWSCEHEKPRRYYVNTAKRNIKPDKLLSVKIWSELRLRGMVQKDTLSHIREVYPKEFPTNWKDDRSCAVSRETIDRLEEEEMRAHQPENRYPAWD